MTDETLQSIERMHEHVAEMLQLLDDLFPEDAPKQYSDEPQRQYGKDRG